VVNALLTQIDRLKKKKNVLILTTSNMTEAIGMCTTVERGHQFANVVLVASHVLHVLMLYCLSTDIAFIDRADIKLRIGLPSQMAIFSLLNTSFGELLRTGIIHIDVRKGERGGGVMFRFLHCKG